MRYYKKLALCLPVVENLWDLSSGLVGPIATQAAGAEGEGHTIRALHCGHTSIPISCAAAVVSQSDSILYSLLQQNKFIRDHTHFNRNQHSIVESLKIVISCQHLYLNSQSYACIIFLRSCFVPWVVQPCPDESQQYHWENHQCCKCPSPALGMSTGENVLSPLGVLSVPEG